VCVWGGGATVRGCSRALRRVGTTAGADAAGPRRRSVRLWPLHAHLPPPELALAAAGPDACRAATAEGRSCTTSGSPGGQQRFALQHVAAPWHDGGGSGSQPPQPQDNVKFLHLLGPGRLLVGSLRGRLHAVRFHPATGASETWQLLHAFPSGGLAAMAVACAAAEGQGGQAAAAGIHRVLLCTIGGSAACLEVASLSGGVRGSGEGRRWRRAAAPLARLYRAVPRPRPRSRPKGAMRRRRRGRRRRRRRRRLPRPRAAGVAAAQRRPRHERVLVEVGGQGPGARGGALPAAWRPAPGALRPAPCTMRPAPPCTLHPCGTP
jgi:hypothetical protein